MATERMDAERLPDEAVVVRGGLCEPHIVKRQSDQEPDGTWGLSVRSGTGMTADQLAREVPAVLNGKIRVSSVGRIRALGPAFDVIPTTGPGYPEHHGTIVIPSRPVSDEDARVVSEAFDDPIPNPARS